MRISIIGTHGIPANYGGFETFAEQLANACAQNDIKVRVINEKDNPTISTNKNIEVVKSEFNKSEEPLKFYKDSLKLAAADSDIILACGVGGSLYYSEAKKLGVRIITCVDGMEHKRDRYSFLQRVGIYFLQKFAAIRSDRLIADSHGVERYWKKRFPKQKWKLKMIAYGTQDCETFDQSILDKFGLKRDEYFLKIARFVPENNIHEYVGAATDYVGSKKFVLVGKLEDTSYGKIIRELCEKHDKIILTDAIYDKKILDTLRQGCFAYVHGHSVGGTNPSLLEAMKAGCACICHDNEFNREVTRNDQLYFDSWDDLSIILNLLEQKKADINDLRKKAGRAANNYTWDRIFAAYFEMFSKLHRKKSII